MLVALIDFGVAVPVAAGLFIGALVLASLAAAVHRRENPPSENIRRRGDASRVTEQDGEVR